MNKRTRKYTVEAQMDKVSKMAGSYVQYCNLESVYNDGRKCYAWQVTVIHDGCHNKLYVGDTLEESLEYFEMQADEAQYRDQKAEEEEKTMNKITDEYESAIREFGHVASMTSGENGAQWMSSDGYEFVIWLDNEDEIPHPASELLQIEIVHEDAGRIKFSMTLPYVTEG